VPTVLTPAALRVAGIVALFVAWGSYLSARSGHLSTRQAGAIVLGFGLALIVLHVLLLRRGGGRPSSDAMLAALLGALPVVPGFVLLLWRTPGAGATVLLFYGIDNHVLAKGLLLAIGRRAGGGIEHNLTVAAILLCSLAFELAPAGHRNALRDLLGIALLAGIALVVRRRLTVGMGLGIALLCLLEMRSIAASGDSLAPVALFGLAGAGLFVCAWLAEKSGGHSSA